MRRRGQAIVLIAIGMATFLAFLGLVLDGGSAYLEQRNLQRAADLAALSGTWAYYNADYRNSDNYNNVAASVAAAQAAVATTLAANGAGGLTPTVTFRDAAGAPLDVSACPPTCPQGWEVRGVTVDVSRMISNHLLQAVGGGSPTVRGLASAQLGSNTGARNEAPLLLQNYTGAGDAVPRIGLYPACANTTDGLRYPVTPVDCRPSTAAAWPAQPLNLEPQWQAPFTPGPPPFNNAPRARFFLLNDPSDSAAAPAATQGAMAGGLSAFIGTCKPGCPGGDPGSTLRYAGTGAPAADPVLLGANDRIAQAGGSWAAQRCDLPLDRNNPLTPDNPRLMRLPITYAAAPGSSGVPGVGSFSVSETLMFCLDSVQGAQPAYALSGYLVEEPSNAATVLSTSTPQPPYFGRDVVVRLTG